MNMTNILLMRQELILISIILILLVATIIKSKKDKSGINSLALFLVAGLSIIGFLPSETGSLFGGMYQLTETTILMKNILNVGVLIIMLQSSSWLNSDDHNENSTEFIIILLSTLVGMNYMISAGDFLMLFLGIELATIPTAILAAYEVKKMKSVEAGVKLVLLGALSTGISMMGVTLLYAANGSIYFDILSETIVNSNLNVLGMLFFFGGLAFKISLVPFHMWTADVYEGAPIPVASYLSVISKGAAVFVLVMILFKVFPALEETWTMVVYIVAIITMTIGNIFAIRQTNIKRFLAFSSIAQAGFILLGIIAGSSMGMATVIYFVLVYVFSNLGAFGVVTAIHRATGKEEISDYRGLYKTNPKLSLLMMLSMFSLAGIPPLAGFFGKFFLFAAAASQGFYWLVIIAVLNTIISLYYYLLIVKAMFISPNDNAIPLFKSDGYMKIGLALAAIGIVVIGLMGGIYDWIFTLSWGV
jgi:NADH-quinone oxidoreductase subunit N